MKFQKKEEGAHSHCHMLQMAFIRFGKFQGISDLIEIVISMVMTEIIYNNFERSSTEKAEITISGSAKNK